VGWPGAAAGRRHRRQRSSAAARSRALDHAGQRQQPRGQRAGLILDATAQALPISETTTANGYRQTVSLSHWGETLAVPPPSSGIPYAMVKA